VPDLVDRNIMLHRSREIGAAGAADGQLGAPSSLIAFTVPPALLKINNINRNTLTWPRGHLRNVPATTNREVDSMVGKTKISNFARILENAKIGDLSGWSFSYELANGLKKDARRDAGGRAYEAYVYGGKVKIYDPNMEMVS
jgi:hypothetical protein